ncbi:MAG: sodium-translocating pyrophosphatase [Candidatus Niyogibacteria bacterium]|nr:sodium-translocating pyrophosphatase [Candidatus Niyogibacteria bacterium]
MNIIYFPILSSLLAILSALVWRARIQKEPSGTEKMKEIAAAIKEGSIAYLKRQYKIVTVVAVILAAMLWFFFGITTAMGFLIGATASGLAGYLGMLTAVSSNSRVTESARKGLAAAFRLAFVGGSVTGFLVVGLGLLVVSVFWLVTKDINALVGLGFGGSLISVFSRLGGGIYTKGADVGADLVGKVEAGIPEDDPRNPAVIADNVGDNVGDCAGMAADLFETYAVTIISTMLLGNLLFPGSNATFIFPLILGAISIIGSLIGTVFVKAKKKENIMRGLYKGLIASGMISAVLFIPATRFFVTVSGETISFAGNTISTISGNWLNLYFASLVGLFITLLIMLFTEYYTGTQFRPVRSIARSSESGHATNIIMGLAVSMEATILPIITIALGMLLAWWLFGLYGIAIAAVAMLSLAGIIVAIDSFGPITDNAGGIAEMSEAPAEVRDITDALDAVGNTTKAVTKGYAIASAGLAALVLFGAYVAEIEKLGQAIIFKLDDPLVLAGIFFGAMLPYLFGSLAMLAVGKTAESIVTEVRRQFKEIPGIMSGAGKPDYARAVDIATKSALREMILPALLPIAVVIAVALIFGLKALGGLLIGIIVTGLFMALSMTSGGAAWDNAKKYIEMGHHGGKGSLAHQAAVTGDTVGDPYKDTAGPAINPMIKVVNIVALLLVGLLM